MPAELIGIGQQAERLARALQDHIRSISAHPDPIWGQTRLHLAHWVFDSDAMVRVPNGIRDEIAPRLQDWMQSEEGTWAMENVPGIEVNGVYDIAQDLVTVVISARVPETTRMEHAMRYG